MSLPSFPPFVRGWPRCIQEHVRALQSDERRAEVNGRVCGCAVHDIPGSPAGVPPARLPHQPVLGLQRSLAGTSRLVAGGKGEVRW